MLKKIIDSLHHENYFLQENFISLSDLWEINSFFTQNTPYFSAAHVGKGNERQKMESVRGDWTFWIDQKNPPIELYSLLKFLEELRLHLNQELYLGLKEFESHLAYYPSGKFYKKHLDQFNRDSSRILTFIFYLHEYWDDSDGGELVLYNDDNSIFKKVIPKPGTFICFLANKFPHEVLAGKRERRSFTGWMHNKIIS